MRSHHQAVRTAGLGLSLALLSGASGIAGSTAQTSEGCGRVEGPIVESAKFTPYEARLSHFPSAPITSAGEPPDSSDSDVAPIDGLPLRWKAGDGDRSSYQYFFEREIRRDVTVPQFQAAGGIELNRDAVPNGQDHTSELLATHGERAVQVQLGDYKAALVWADPESNGVRPHHLYWSDGTYNYALYAVRSPVRLIELGRELVCD